MDSISRASLPIYDSGASTSTAYSEPASTNVERTLRARRAIKRNVSSSTCDQEEKPVKKRKVQLVEYPNISKKRREAEAKHRLESEILRTKKRNAVKYIEQWLNTKGVNTDNLKPKDTATDKLAQYKKKLLEFKDNEIVNSCQDSLDELAQALIDFKLENKLNKNQKKKKQKINIANLKQLIKKTKKLKNQLTVNKKFYTQFLNLRNKVAKKISYNNIDARKKNYTNALYHEAKSLISDTLPEKELSEINENMDLLERVIGISPKPTRKKQTDSNKWIKEKSKKTKENLSRLEKILQEKYNITFDKRSDFNLIYAAKKSIEKLNQYGELAEKTYTHKDVEQFDKRSSRSKKRNKSNKEYNQELRDKKNNIIMDLQKLLGISLLNKQGNPDIEKTILAACDYFEKCEPDSHLSTSTHEVAEEELAVESILTLTSPGYEPLIFELKELACSSKNTHNLQKELAYAELRETLKHWPALSTLPGDNRELICAAEYCINSIYWKEPITDEAYQRYRLSKLVSKRHEDTPQELINVQLDSLKQQLSELSLHTEEMNKKQDIEIIRAVNEYLITFQESDYR